MILASSTDKKEIQFLYRANPNNLKEKRKLTMHTTAIVAMRSYCVYAGTFASIKKRKKPRNNMSFFKKLFGKSDKDDKLNQSQSINKKEISIENILDNYRKNKTLENDVFKSIIKVDDAFQSNLNGRIDELAFDEEKLIDWLTEKNFTQNELESLSDLFLEICTDVRKKDKDNQLGIFLINAVFNVTTFAATDMNIKGLEKFKTNADKASVLLQNVKQDTSHKTETSSVNSDDNITEIQLNFKKEIEDTFPYYFSMPKMQSTDFTLNAKDGTKVMPHAAFQEQFHQWQNIQSIWDRRSLIFSILDNILSNNLKLWQVLDRFTTDRNSLKALEIAREHGKGEQLNDANYWYALGRAQFHSGLNKDAENSLENCLNIDNSHKRGRIIKADLLHSTNRQKEAHEIYNSILKESDLQGSEKAMNLKDLVGFNGIIHSPIYALAWLENHSETDSESWENIAGEFYYSPYFRARHAYYLIETKDKINQMKGFAKLHSLSNEMPWFKEGVVNTYHMIEQLGLQDKMKDDREKLGQIIRKNSWE